MSGLGKCNICGKDAEVNYPLLAGSPSFCSAHHNSHDAGPFGCDFTGPDDFDIPWDLGEPVDLYEELEDYGQPHPLLKRWYRRPFKRWRKKFVWTDKEGNDHKLRDIDNAYLYNIIEWLRRQNEAGTYNNIGVRLFLEDELVYRRKQGSL